MFDYVSNAAFDEKVARYFFKQYLEALKFCHDNGICHRDLKPENVLLDDDYNIKIADFGFANQIERTDGGLTTSLGTPGFMAPE